MPLFSIIIPAYNRGSLIKGTIDSVLSQSYKDYELIIVDDGSTDNTADIVKSYGGQIKYYFQENGGAESARNLGAEKCSGSYFLFLDSDDILFPSALDVYSKVISYNHPSFIIGKVTEDEGGLNENLVGTSIHIITLKSYVYKDRAVHKTCSAFVIERDLFFKIGGFRKGTFPVEDLDLILRTDGKGDVVIINYPPNLLYRIHEDNSLKQINKVVEKLIKVLNDEKTDRNFSFHRRALIGGSFLNWLGKSIFKLSGKNIFLILKNALPEMAAAAIRKFLTLTRIIQSRNEVIN